MTFKCCRSLCTLGNSTFARCDDRICIRCGEADRKSNSDQLRRVEIYEIYEIFLVEGNVLFYFYKKKIYSCLDLKSFCLCKRE